MTTPVTTEEREFRDATREAYIIAWRADPDVIFDDEEIGSWWDCAKRGALMTFPDGAYLVPLDDGDPR